MKYMTNYNPEELITFWFSDRVSQLWYNSTPEFDSEFEKKFSFWYQAAYDGLLENWKSTSNGCLALIILLDQYPLNVFRNNKKSFATEKQAIQVAEHCIKYNLDTELSRKQQSFIYMPFMHSENSEHQQKSVELFKKLDPENHKFASHHYDIVTKYGRFPHRNKILGRESTPEEIEYLSSKEAFTG